MADQNKDRPTAAVEASGSERESEAWEWLGQLYPNDAPSDLAYDANEMIDAFLAGWTQAVANTALAALKSEGK